MHPQERLGSTTSHELPKGHLWEEVDFEKRFDRMWNEFVSFVDFEDPKHLRYFFSLDMPVYSAEETAIRRLRDFTRRTGLGPPTYNFDEQYDGQTWTALVHSTSFIR